MKTNALGVDENNVHGRTRRDQTDNAGKGEKKKKKTSTL